MIQDDEGLMPKSCPHAALQLENLRTDGENAVRRRRDKERRVCLPCCRLSAGALVSASRPSSGKSKPSWNVCHFLGGERELSEQMRRDYEPPSIDAI